MRPSAVGPRAEKFATWPAASVAPIASTLSASAGDERDEGAGPSSPTAVTTMMPRRAAASAATVVTAMSPFRSASGMGPRSVKSKRNTTDDRMMRAPSASAHSAAATQRSSSARVSPGSWSTLASRKIAS